ncbi:MAG: DNA-3-methyladenine glycosylase 2 family protein, partial [Bacteroidota bacterium]
MSYDYDIAYKLLRKDPVMKQVIKATGMLVPEKRKRDIYGSLLRSVIGQQLSVKAAATIHSRFLELFPKRDPEPLKVLMLSAEQLRSVGLSGQKSSYVISVAEHAV